MILSLFHTVCWYLNMSLVCSWSQSVNVLGVVRNDEKSVWLTGEGGEDGSLGFFVSFFFMSSYNYIQRILVKRYSSHTASSAAFRHFRIKWKWINFRSLNFLFNVLFYKKKTKKNKGTIFYTLKRNSIWTFYPLKCPWLMIEETMPNPTMSISKALKL